MSQPTVMMAEMTWPEFAERLEHDPVVFLPTGMLEQHGPHLPMGVDHMLPAAIAAVVADEVDGIVAPPVNYGYKSMPRSGGGPGFPGSCGLDGATLSAVVRDWEFLTEETLARVFPEGYPGIELEHAAVLETSLMMHFHPELVRADRIPDNPPMDAPPYDVWPARTAWVPESGSLTSAAGASAEKGAHIVEQYRRDMAAAVRRELMR